MVKKEKKARPQKKKGDGYKMPPPIPPGEVIHYNDKKWMIGPSIGVGGCGEIYSACEYREGESTSSDVSDYPYVVKIEPEENGPLFVEMHFYKRNGDRTDIRQFMKSRNLSQLGMPTYCGSSTHKFGDEVLRFLIVERYGKDLWKIFKEVGKRFPVATVFQLGLQMLDVLDYIHSRSYIHADIKGANILMGIKEGTENQAYLLDFGLAYRIVDNNYRPDPKSAHEGTIEYTSTDRHIGAKTMRGDLEILGYNLLQWLIGELPWEKQQVLEDPKKVHKMKTDLMNNIRTKITNDYPHVPDELIQFFEYIKTLEPKDIPDYTVCREIFESYLKSVGKTRSSQLEFTTTNNNEQPMTTDAWPLSSNGDNSKISERDSQNKLNENQEQIVTKNKKNKNKRNKDIKVTASVENDIETKQFEDNQDLKITRTKKNKKKKDKIPEDTSPVEDDAESEYADDIQEQKVTKKKKNKDKRDKNTEVTALAENDIESDQPDDIQDQKVTKTKKNKKKRGKTSEYTAVEIDVESEQPDDNEEQQQVTKTKKKRKNENLEEIYTANEQFDVNQWQDCTTPKKNKRKRDVNLELAENDAASEQPEDDKDQKVAKKKRDKKTEDTPPAENDPENDQSDDNQDQKVAKPKKNKKQKYKETEDADEAKSEDDDQKQRLKQKEKSSDPTTPKKKINKKRKAPAESDSENEFLDMLSRQKKRNKNMSYTTTQLYGAKLPVKIVEKERPFLEKILRSDNKTHRTCYKQM